MPLVSWVIRRARTAQTSGRQLSSPGKRPIPLVRRLTSPSDRSSRLVSGMKGGRRHRVPNDRSGRCCVWGGEYGATVRGRGALRQTWTGRPVSFDGLRARVSRWPPLRLARMRRERGSVGVVLPAGCFTRPVRVGGEGSEQTVFRLGRAPRLRTGGDLAGRSGAPGRPDRDVSGGAAGVRRQPGADRRGRAGGDR